jgi:hypothetical protein
MKRFLFYAMVVGAMASGAVFAQDSAVVQRADLSGTWEIADRGSVKGQSLVITQSGDEITMNESRVFEKKTILNTIKLFTDKRGERNMYLVPGGDAPIEFVSKTEWKKGKLVRRSTAESPAIIGGTRHALTIRETYTYSLAKDGNALTIEVASVSDNPFSATPISGYGKKTYSRVK